MAPSNLPHNYFPILKLVPTIQKRSDSCENNYTTGCTTHRTILLIVSLIVCACLCIGFIILPILKRSRGRANQHGVTLSHGPNKGFYNELNSMDRQAGFAPARLPSERAYASSDMSGRSERYWRKGNGWGGDETARYEAPPPYTPREPEAARLYR